ncbi:hypothetical protein AB0M43_10545 [Longispora sp. NPDC051575]|uniref:hypothetical protein n=1 Tax=Longispora sp. NPDC051575 TaxID=3154943 RepID=UPI00341DB1BD
MDEKQPGAAHGYPGLPQTRNSALTPLGEIEQAGKIASGLSRTSGWRRTVVRIGVILAILAMLVPAGIGVYQVISLR